jgi:orotate phosphoribosyltransferase
MIYNDEVALTVAEFLLQIKAIKLEPTKPFTWASGWKSPIYCDNRVTLSYPTIRNFIRQKFVEIIETKMEKPATIAGVATGGIAHGVLVAQELGVPFVYVRPESKKHGLGNQIEGQLVTTAGVVVVEDLVSTGKSSLAAVEALRSEGCDVKHMLAIFDYGFNQTETLFQKSKIDLVTLCNYEHLIKKAVELDYINHSHLEALMNWRENPAEWGK